MEEMNRMEGECKIKHSDNIYKEDMHRQNDKENSKEYEKIKIAEGLLKSLEKKKENIVLQTSCLNSFNKRLELLLACLDAYSFESQKEESLEEERVASPGEAKSLGSREKNRNLESSYEDRQSTACEDEGIGKESIERRVERIFSTKANKRLALDIYNVIKSNKNIPFDDLVRGIKHSKYKVVEIINTLIKERLVIKSFDKGFVYRINGNIS